MFHHIKGTNVKFERNDTAVWFPTETGGEMFSSQPLNQGQDMVLKLEGTGGVELGIINEDPAMIVSRWHDQEFYQFLHDVKICKRSCTINIMINYETLVVTSTYGSGIYTQKLKPGKKYWLVANVRYGEVKIKIQNTDGSSTKYSFYNIFGKNIEVSNSTDARSLTNNPASLCIYRLPLELGTRLALYIKPKPHEGTTPGRYYLRLFATDIRPEDLKRDHPDKFDINCDVKSEKPKWTEIETFVKEDCHGKITLDLKPDSMKYMSPNGKSSQQDYKPRNGNDVWLVLELYGISVQIKKESEPRTPPNIGLEIPDARPLEPRSPSAGFMSVGSNFTPSLMSIQDNDENAAAAAQVSRPPNWNCKDKGSETVLLEKAIRKNWTHLLQQITSVGHIVDLMYEHNYITLQQMDEINKGEDKVRAVLLIMVRKPIQRALLERIFLDTEQDFLLKKISDEEEKM